jgi:hypothetical protein
MTGLHLPFLRLTKIWLQLHVTLQKLTLSHRKWMNGEEELKMTFLARPFYSEGIAYHEKLVKAGTQSNLKVYKGVGHPFGHWDGELEAAREFVQDTLDALRKAYKL